MLSTGKRVLEHPHLERAPVVEALIDFRVKPKLGLTAQDLAKIYDTIKGTYPTTKLISRLHAELHVEVKDGVAVGKEPARPTASATHMGFRYESKDGLYVMQAQLEGFTLSRLKPYERWESLIEESKKLWDLYVVIANPTSITRVATRYINRLEIPLPLKDFSEYLTVPPEMPEGSPQLVSEFLSRMVAHDPASGASMVFTQAMEGQQTSENILPVILDFDVFKEGSFDVDSNSYWELLAKFRGLKNDAFFGSVTPKSLELLK